MEKLSMKLIVIISVIHVVSCVDIEGPESVAVERGSTIQLQCRDLDGGDRQFIWEDITPGRLAAVFSGSTKSPEARYENFNLETSPASASIMSISDIQIEDESSYECKVFSVVDPIAPAAVIVEVKSTLSEIAITPALEDGTDMIAGDSYNVQCEADGARPRELFKLYINNVEAQTDNKNETFRVNSGNPNLTDTTTIFTITPTSNNNGQDMFCRTTGHQLSSLNQDSDSSTLNVRYPPPSSGIMTVDLTQLGENLIITCNVDVNEANPVISSFYIYENGTLIASMSSHQKPTPDMETTYKCVAGNYLGNTSAVGVYSPDSTIVPSPTTGQTTILGPNATPTSDVPTSRLPDDETNDAQTGSPAVPIGAIVGGVIVGLVVIGLIIVLVYLYMTGRICQKSKSGSGYGSTHGPKENKVATSTNGKDVEKSAPKAAPRTSTDVMHTTDNPGGEQYAMVSRPPKSGSGGPDHPDTGHNGRGQNDSNLHYADIDLSDKAGHTERRVPQNDKDVVVYSSILV